MTQTTHLYAGDITPLEAWEMLKSQPEATLVDVRSRMEWMLVGVPDISALGKKPVMAEWR